MTKTLAQELAEQSIVLLRNKNKLLPLREGQTIAVFGRAQLKTVFSGNGSGASRGQGTSILDALEKRFQVAPALAAFYRKTAEGDNPKTIDWDLLLKTGNSGLAYELFGQYTPPVEEYAVPEALLHQSRTFADTAVLALGRSCGGEECDRKLHDDYLLTASEKALIKAVCGVFERVVLVLNINGQIDLGWLEEAPQIESVLFIGIPGEDGAEALANVLTGAVNPSGRLAFSMFRRFEDFPAAKDFSFDKDAPLCYADYGLDAAQNGSTGYEKSPVTVYREGVYNGYRTLGEKPLFPFGWGLSYTTFEAQLSAFEKKNGAFEAKIAVTNTGSVPGREAVLLYQKRDVPKLWGFEKTALLAPGETQTLDIKLSYRELAEYDEDRAAWVIRRGVTHLLLNGEPIAAVSVPEDLVVEQCENRLSIKPCNRDKLSFASPAPAEPLPLLNPTLLLLPYDVAQTAKTQETLPALPDLTDKELAALCVGYGPGIPFSAFSKTPLPNTVDELTVNDHPSGPLGYVSPAIPAKGIHSVCYKDGPSGVGVVTWPTEMLIACSFDRALLYRFGDAIGAECEAREVDVWLAPAVNLHRHPLCGRNFEYYSEDPLLTGALAVAAAKGVQENHPVLVCPKHFAANEQETYRRGNGKRNVDAVDSIAEEKTLREMYLKPFEMLVRQANIASIMTSFNKINGCFAAGSRDLCTHILREEWGFRGCIVSDWGDMDAVVDGADAVAAGNDVVMPGGPPVIAQLLTGMDEGRVTRKDMEVAVGHLLMMLEVCRRPTSDSKRLRLPSVPSARCKRVMGELEAIKR